MKKNIYSYLILFVFSLNSYAQEDESKKYLLTTNQNVYGISSVDILDPYLSQMTYSGAGLTYSHISRKFLSPENLNLSKQTSFKITSAIAVNPASTSSMLYYGYSFGYGLHYHLRYGNGLMLMGGGVFDVDFGSKYVARNVNNPVSVDIATNLNFSGIALYNIPLRKRTLQLEITLQIPLIGYMFVPPVGESYYELFDVGNLSGTTHMSSVFNKQGVNQSLAIDVPFKSSTWRFGVGFSNLKYIVNDMVYKRNEFNVSVGTTFDDISFKGRKNTKPQNFISSNK